MNEFIRKLADCPVKVIGIVLGAKPDKPACRVKFVSEAERKAVTQWLLALFVAHTGCAADAPQMSELPEATLEIKVP